MLRQIVKLCELSETGQVLTLKNLKMDQVSQIYPRMMGPQFCPSQG